LTAKTANKGGVFGRLGLVLCGLAARVGGSMAGQRWFGWMPTRMNFCCFNSSFLPLFCDGVSLLMMWGCLSTDGDTGFR
jgi:hypothetical protein